MGKLVSFNDNIKTVKHAVYGWSTLACHMHFKSSLVFAVDEQKARSLWTSVSVWIKQKCWVHPSTQTVNDLLFVCGKFICLHEQRRPEPCESSSFIRLTINNWSHAFCSIPESAKKKKRLQLKQKKDAFCFSSIIESLCCEKQSYFLASPCSSKLN